MATNEEKLAVLKELVGDPALVQAFLQDSEATEKAAEARGFAYKEAGARASATATKEGKDIDLDAILAQLGEVTSQVKELKKAVDEVEAEMDEDEDEEGDEDMPPPAKSKGAIAKKEAGAGGVDIETLPLSELTVKEFAGLMYDSLVTSLPHLATNKEAGLAEAFKEHAATQVATIQGLETRLTETQAVLAETTKELGQVKQILAVLADIQPKAVTRGYKASSAVDNIVGNVTGGQNGNGTALKQAEAPDVNGFLKDLIQG